MRRNPKSRAPGRHQVRRMNQAIPPPLSVEGVPKDWRLVQPVGLTHHDTLKWDDSENVKAYPYSRLSKVGIWSGQFVNGVECTWEAFDPATAKWITIEGKVHLGNHHSFTLKQVDLERDEHITSVSLWSGSIIDQLSFATNKGRSFHFGGDGGFHKTVALPEGHRVVAFVGGVGGHIHNLGCVTCPLYPETWNQTNHHLFPQKFKEAVRAILMARLCSPSSEPRHPESQLHRLPPELMNHVIQLLAADPACWLASSGSNT